MYNNKIYEDLKDRYKEAQEILDENPLCWKFISILSIIFCGLIIIWTIIFTFAKRQIMRFFNAFCIIGLILYLITIIIMIILVLYVKYCPKIKNRKEDSIIIHKRILEDEAKKYQVSASELGLYLYSNYETPPQFKKIKDLINWASCILSIIYLPSWSKGNGISLLLITFICNIIVSKMFEILQKEVDSIYMDELKKYVIEPFKDEFKKVEDMKL